ncbi:aminotransferase class I/II-fold pyridoxal phosphate-dependent enzyme [Mediterraneibacter gnavus]|uniref:aminotransferase class I/II-fold pyridoxal phosphate-dependent enzyme n=1 Tax=Mediterraneibacter gnavus TaxID=33038 RepID=UPI0018AA7491|nr:aminotransferase class I/II-fold pyridoxal phosphate-dependent enzyme [Mediterraneibacter gnavus]MDB8718827.1 aminotransferase class I/II-fold pyridoxal phosphate-dependent enzyme [Mediterraneibacter gnavus]
MERAAQKIWLARPEILGNEMQYVQDSFESGWITTAFKEDSYIGRFEQSVREFLGGGYPVALQSGTAAIHLALRLCGVEKGDYVFCSDLTFTASANPIRYLGAEPVFIDSDPVTFNMNPDDLEMAFESGLHPKAVVVVHVYGMPADMKRILDICNRYEVPVIEDSTESFGSAVRGKKTGTFGRFGCMSFNGNKMITAGGTGGMLICQNEEDAERASFLASQAKEPVPWYEHKEIGYNYRLANSNAAFGVGQMEHIEERISKKMSIYDIYQKRFAEYADWFKLYRNVWNGNVGNSWLSCIEINPELNKKPEYLMEKLKECNIESRRIWKPLHSQPLYENCRMFSRWFSDCCMYMSDYCFLTGLCLPSDTRMTPEEVNFVADRVIEILEV